MEAQTCFQLKDTVQLSEMYKMFFFSPEKKVHRNIHRTAVTLIQFWLLNWNSYGMVSLEKKKLTTI